MTCSSVFGQSVVLSLKRGRRWDIAMTTEYHDETEEDSSSFWNKDPPHASFSGVSRLRRWLFPSLVFVIFFILIVSLGVSNSETWSRLWTVDKTVSNLSSSVSSSQLLTAEMTADVQRLKFSVGNNKDQLSAVSEALKQLSALDTLTRSIETLKCSLEHLMNNGSAAGGCCPLGWEPSSSSCFLFSRDLLTWPDARDFCNGRQAQLAILHTDEDWDFVTSRTSGAFYWIGLTDGRTGEWEWVNQTPYVMNRRRWKPGQPDAWTGHGMGHGDEDCAHLHNDGRLNDLHCSSRLRYVCQTHSRGS